MSRSFRRAQDLKDSGCRIHFNETFVRVCETCDYQLVCVDCLSSDQHKTHSIIKIDHAAEIRRNNFEKLLTAANQKKTTLTSVIQTLKKTKEQHDKNTYTDIIKKIERREEMLISLVKESSNSLKKQVLQEEEKYSNLLEKCLTEKESHLGDILGYLKKCGDNPESLSSQEMIDLTDRLIFSLDHEGISFPPDHRITYSEFLTDNIDVSSLFGELSVEKPVPITTGTRTSLTGGTHRTSLTEGTHRTSLTEGTHRTSLTEGTHRTSLTEGTHRTSLTEGTHRTSLTKGTHRTSLTEGTHRTSLTEGTHRTSLTEGTHRTSLTEDKADSEAGHSIKEVTRFKYAHPVQEIQPISGNMAWIIHNVDKKPQKEINMVSMAGTVVAKVKLDSIVTGITRSPSGDTLICCWTDRSVRSITGQSSVIQFYTEDYPNALAATHNGEIVVSFIDKGRVLKYNMMGHALNCLEPIDKSGRKYGATRPHKLSVCNKTHKIAVVDQEKPQSVVVVSEDLRPLWRYNGSTGTKSGRQIERWSESEFLPNNVLFDREGNLLIADANLTVIMVDTEGYALRLLITNLHVTPHTINFDESLRLWIGLRDGLVKIMDCKY